MIIFSGKRLVKPKYAFTTEEGKIPTTYELSAFEKEDFPIAQ